MNFDRMFKTVTYLLVLNGVIVLTLAEGSLLYIVIALVAAPLSWWVVEMKSRGLGKTPVYLIAGLLILFAVMDGIIITGSVFLSLAHLLVLVQVLKMFQLKVSSDYLQMFAISFIHLLVASVLTTDLFFALFFVAYMVLAIWAMLLLQLKKSSESHGGDPQGIVNRRFFAGISLVIVLAFATTALFFTIIPRVGMGLTVGSFNKAELVTGFSEQVELGEIGRIKKDFRVVMRVGLLNTAPQEGFRPLWRGKVYDHYGERQWKSSFTGRYRPLRRYGEKIPLRLQVKADQSKVLKYLVQLERTESRIMFLADSPAAVIVDMPFLWTEESGTVYAPEPLVRGIKYTAYSFIPNRRVDYIDTTEGADPVYLQLPPLSPRVKELAMQITAPGEDNYDKAGLIEDHLLESYGYTLDLTIRTGMEPVEYFLFHWKKGNCEYFASAMVLMLRSVGIPARMVGGFRGGEWNRFGKFYLVRQSNAHTWVEAYLPPVGWLSFDPTPAEADPAFLLPAFLKIFPRMADALRWKWQSRIIAYDFQDQRMAYLKVVRKAGEINRWGAVLKNKVRAGVKALFEIKGSLPLLVILAVVLSVTAAVKLRRLRKGMQKKGSPPQLRFYRRYLRIMAGKGYRRNSSMTPMELASQAATEGGEPYVHSMWLTDIYYGARYGGETISPAKIKEIELHLKALKEAPAK